jgi:hypothetical protein
MDFKTGKTYMHVLVTEKKNGTQDLVMVFLCIEIAIGRMQLAYACP